MFNRLKSLTVAFLLVSVSVPLLTYFVRAGFSRADAQTPTENTKTEADKIEQLGVQQYRTGLYPQALQTYGRALELYKQQNNEVGIAKTLNNFGYHLF